MSSAAVEPRLTHWLDQLAAPQLPHFGQFVTWLLLATCFFLASLQFEMVPGARQGPVTLLAFLPAAWLDGAALFYVFRGLVICGALLWLLQVGLPWSCWLATIGFTGLWSIHIENTTNGAHVFNAANQLLVVQSLWYTFYAGEIRTALSQNRFWTTLLYPNWAFWLGLFYLGLFHTFAGLAKISHSGLDWPNGVSLQLWAYWDGRPDGWMRELMISNRPLVIVMQWLTIVFETSGILALFSRPLRWLIGAMLVSFYIGVVLTFDYGFHLNLLLTALYFFPFDYWLPQWCRQLHGRMGSRRWLVSNAWRGRLIAALVARFDFLQCIQLELPPPTPRIDGVART